MYKKVLATSMVAASLFFTGCGDDTTSCRFDVQSDLDLGNFDDALTKLDGECADSFTESDRYFNIATAYMGKAGFGALDVVTMVLDADTEDGDAFGALTRSVEEHKNDDSLELLNKAELYYLRSIAPNADVDTLSTDLCDTNEVNSRIENACFYVGFNQTFQATATITYMTNDVDALVSDNEDTPLDMQASLDALSWATGADKPNVSGESVTINGIEYGHLTVTEGDSGEYTYYRLAKSATPSAENSTVITNGYCTTDGDKAACEGIEGDYGSIDTTLAAAQSCYACPVVIDGNETQDVAQLLVDSLNGGTGTIVGVSDDEDIQSSLDEFVQDITGDDNARAGETQVTLDQVINYLNQ
jgi:hypothetical protein